MGIRVPADPQALYKPLPEIILVCGQHRFQGIVQKLEILFQLGEVPFGDGGKSLFLHAEAIFVPVEVVVLTEIFCVARQKSNRNLICKIPQVNCITLF